MSAKKIAISKESAIYFETDAFTNLNAFLKKNAFTKVFILADNHTFENCYPILLQNCLSLQNAEIIELESGEQSKTLDTCLLVWQTLSELNADKNSLIINLGGGVITDLGGFIASIYKRGISFIHVPTSLLAMADASVGGKNGVDLGKIKNQLGTITQANSVFIYTPFLNTLDGRHLKNGMAEVIKMGFIADEKLINDIRARKKELAEIIYKSVSLKSSIVKKDPNDKGIRKILNFGHTIGHAIESTLLGTKQELLHGEAIAIGMLIESLIAHDQKLITKVAFTKVIDLIKPHYKLIKFTATQQKTILEFIQHDKKNKNNKTRMSLITGIGSCTYNKEVSTIQIQKAFLNYSKLINA